MKVVADTWCRRRAASPLLLSEPVAVGLLRPHVVGVGEPPDLRLAQSIDAHELSAGVPMLAERPAQTLTLLSDGLVDSFLRIARRAESVDGRNLIPHPKRIETAIAVVELGAYLRHRIMRVVGDTDGSAVLGSLLRRLLIASLASLISFSLEVLYLGIDTPFGISENRPRQFHSDSRFYHAENLLSCDDRHTLRELDGMQLATAYHCIISPHADAEQFRDLLGAVELLSLVHPDRSLERTVK